MPAQMTLFVLREHGICTHRKSRRKRVLLPVSRMQEQIAELSAEKRGALRLAIEHAFLGSTHDDLALALFPAGKQASPKKTKPKRKDS
jgi:hypothetical protein